jgi:hypothetical protein
VQLLVQLVASSNLTKQTIKKIIRKNRKKIKIFSLFLSLTRRKTCLSDCSLPAMMCVRSTAAEAASSVASRSSSTSRALSFNA